jgi:hypothetical protein
VNGANIDIE